MTESGTFACYWNRAKNDIKIEVQVFFIHLLAPLSLAGLPYFYLVYINSALDLVVALAIDKVDSIDRNVTINFF